MLVRNQVDNSIEPPSMVRDEGLVRDQIYVDAIMCDMDSGDVARKQYSPKDKSGLVEGAGCTDPSRAWSEGLGLGLNTCFDASFVAVLIFLAAIQMYGPLALILLTAFVMRALRQSESAQSQE